MKEITFTKEARELLHSGINKLHDAVAKTMGPNGQCVIIPSKKEYGKYIVTKDGVSVAEQIFFKNPIENIGAQLVKEAALKTADEAGDGTTTATVLATAFINNLKDFNSNDINKAFDEIIPKVIKQLELNSKQLKREDIKYVASISANNDMEIANIIQQAYNHSDIVKVEESSNNNDTLEQIDGMQLNVSYFSKLFVNNDKKTECKLDEPNVIVIDGRLDNLKPLKSCLEHCANNNETLVIIVEDISEQVLKILETNVINDAIKLCVIKSPGFGQHRKDLLRDICDFTGSVLIQDNKEYTSTIMGKLSSIIVDKHKSTLVKHNDVNIEEFLSNLKYSLELKELTDYDKDLIKQRYENLSAKISVIKVGGKTESEMKERFDRYDDAIKAVGCALEEGIVEGGGVALLRVIFSEEFYINELNVKNLSDAILISLLSPLNNIRKNGAIINENIPSGMFKQNIIDPLKVTKTALLNAVAVAKTILSTDAVVLNEREWN